MAAAKKNKSPGRQVVIQQILAALEKRYRSEMREVEELPVLVTLIYAICLEDTTFVEADLFYERIGTEFHDFNEARVSSITELSRVFLKSPSAEWKAFRLRNLLGHVFESFYAFDFDSLLRKSNAQANRLLGRVPELSYFARNFALSHCMGIHILPLDIRSRDAVAWLGLGTPGQTPQRTGAALKSVVRKADADRFCGLVRCFAADPKIVKRISVEQADLDKSRFELDTAVKRLETIFAEVDGQPRKKSAAKKSAAKKTAAKKTTAKKKTAKKKTAKKKR